MNREQKIERMKELIELLNRAGRAYYQESREIMSNFEYDRLYDEQAVHFPGQKSFFVSQPLLQLLHALCLVQGEHGLFMTFLHKGAGYLVAYVLGGAVSKYGFVSRSSPASSS